MKMKCNFNRSWDSTLDKNGQSPKSVDCEIYIGHVVMALVYSCWSPRVFQSKTATYHKTLWINDKNKKERKKENRVQYCETPKVKFQTNSSNIWKSTGKCEHSGTSTNEAIQYGQSRDYLYRTKCCCWFKFTIIDIWKLWWVRMLHMYGQMSKKCETSICDTYSSMN